MYVVISRLGTGDPAAREQEDRLAALCAACPGTDVLVVPHLYHLSEGSPVWDRLAALGGPLVVVSWLHPRPAEWVLRSHGLGADGLTTLSLLHGSAAVQQALGARRDAGGADDAAGSNGASAPQSPLPLGVLPPDARAEELPESTAPRWYPVIDGARCTECGHCLQFCLFGVYEATPDGGVVAANPDRCKAGCPACSRICPNGAILFPLYEKDDAIAGAPGRIMQPDAAARKMFYTRTGARCPECGQEGPARPAPARDGAACPECGRSLAPAPAASAAREVYDEIDALIADLDDLAERRA